MFVRARRRGVGGGGVAGSSLCTVPAFSFVLLLIFRLSLFAALGLQIGRPDLETRLPLGAGVPSDLALLAGGSMTKSVQGEGETEGRSHLLQATGNEEGKNKGKGKYQTKALKVDGMISQRRVFFDLRLHAVPVSSIRGRQMWLAHEKQCEMGEDARVFTSLSPHRRQ